MPYELEVFLAVFATSCAVTALVVATRPMHIGLSTRDHDTNAVQAAHDRPTPRIGGVGVVLVTVGALLFALPSIPHDSAAWFSLSLTPVFVAGLVEDTGYPVRPNIRLLAAAFSSVLVIMFLDTWITQSGIPGLDAALTFAPFAIAVTLLWTTGLCHSFNLIDGVNGLAGGLGVLIALGIATIAWQVDDRAVMMAALVVAAALSGFLVFNFPRGHVFLGDAGAYAVGHVLAWLGIFLVVRSEQVAGVSVGLMFFWPVADTFLAIYRRRRAGRRADQPDRLHFHQLVMRGLEIRVLGASRRGLSNPLSTVVVLPMAGAPIVMAVFLRNDPLWALLSLAMFGAIFVTTYSLGLRITRRAPWRRAFQPIEARRGNR
ncbi:MAG: glycosyltransferase [Sediminimonas sp.]|uniref:MraY family glycosyltransferase n=1 Tax=Sediminimonas sp. TaxID=2823379 RepID=UPI00287046BC|nr:glycosyltransferase [Sediminimonas sp.]MDR9484900.1 glycosyltransferase [Sediminimonas sp.]